VRDTVPYDTIAEKTSVMRASSRVDNGSKGSRTTRKNGIVKGKRGQAGTLTSATLQRNTFMDQPRVLARRGLGSVLAPGSVCHLPLTMLSALRKRKAQDLLYLLAPFRNGLHLLFALFRSWTCALGRRDKVLMTCVLCFFRQPSPRESLTSCLSVFFKSTER
jgi:hypothetical protein